MAYMTEEEAARLDDFYTNTTQDFSSGKPGFFAKQKAMAIVVDEFTARYLTAKAITTKHTPAELISEMVQRDIAAGQ